jgi:hypothetical protein
MQPSIASLRTTTECRRCKTHLIQPEWSECVSSNKTIHLWKCCICGHEFETVDNRLQRAASEDELIERFLPNLLVA